MSLSPLEGDHEVSLTPRETEPKNGSHAVKPLLGRAHPVLGSAFGYPRDFLKNRFVYVVISPRAGGLSVGVNMNPDQYCNFDCVYCEVDRSHPPTERQLDVPVMVRELEETIAAVTSGRLREHSCYKSAPEELLQLRHVTLSGDGDPTLCPNFIESVQAVMHVRALGRFPFYKIVLVTNATGLNQPDVQTGISFLTNMDEVWAKLDAGTQAYMEKINRTQVSLEQVLANILDLARKRPVIIQSLFPAINDLEPPEEEIEEYAQRLLELKRAGAQIPLVQIYSATRPTPNSQFTHLPLRILSRIAHKVKKTTGLNAEVF